MASVFKKHGNWFLRFRDSQGRWRRRVCEARTKTEAVRMADDLEQRCERQRLGLEPLPPTGGGDTVGELLEWWLETYPAATESTQAKNVATVRKHLLGSTIVGISAARLTPGDVERLLHAKQDSLGPQTLNHLRMFLHRAYSKAIETERFVAENPIERVKRRKVPKRPPDYLDAQEVPLLLASLRSTHHDRGLWPLVTRVSAP